MTKQEVDELLFLLEGEMDTYHYFHNRYACELMAWMLESQGRMSVTEAKKRPEGKYLKQPGLKTIIAQHQELEADLFRFLWPGQVHCFGISFGTWGEKENWDRTYYQTSRPGYNLVLQLNFSQQHEAAHAIYANKFSAPRFNYECHPVVLGRHTQTLSWARIDIDWDSGTVLIEEIQSDWMSHMQDIQGYFRRLGKRKGLDYLHQKTKYAVYAQYAEALRFESKHWPEMTLLASLDLIRNQLGLRKVWMHSAESGARVKYLPADSQLPTSHYSKLPKRFGFEKTDAWPEFIRRDWARHKRGRWKDIPEANWWVKTLN